MPLTCENLLSISALKSKRSFDSDVFNNYTFMTFQDGFRYLIKAFGLYGKKALVPSFYCDITLQDMKNNGTEVFLCRNDEEEFDVDIDDFKKKLLDIQPDIIIVYNYFGKTSRLYKNKEWLELLKPDAIIISDFAHALLPQHKIEFLAPFHFYIDSTRKPVSCMMAHMLAPPGYSFQKQLIRHFSFFQSAFVFVYLLKNFCFYAASLINNNALARLGMYVFGLHDKFIWPENACYAGFWWDKYYYDHIDFKRIANHRHVLFQEYMNAFLPLQEAGHIKLFPVPDDEEKKQCFFYVRIKEYESIKALLKFMNERGYWIERLWEFDFDAFHKMPPDDLKWAKSIIVFPYTLATKPAHIHEMASLLNSFFSGARKQGEI